MRKACLHWDCVAVRWSWRNSSLAKTVEILLYDGMNELDFGAVYDMLTSVEVVMPGGRLPQRGFVVDTVADRIAPVETAHGLKIIPHKGLAASLGTNILIVPGGPGARRPNIAAGVVEWLTRNIGHSELIAAVSTGVFILGKAGLIHNRRVATHYTMADDLHRLYPRAEIVPGVRVALDGRNLMTSAGGTAAVDLALAIIQRFYGTQVAQHSADRVEYPYVPPPPLPPAPEFSVSLD
jgi:transcriptional regulator GlxA family with amidase domain